MRWRRWAGAIVLCTIVCLYVWSEGSYQIDREIMLAAADNNVSALGWATRVHPNLNFVDGDFRMSPLAIAVENGNYEAAEFLVRHGAKSRWQTPMGAPVRMARDEGMRKILKQAVDWPASR